MAIAISKSLESCRAAEATTDHDDIDIDIPVFDLFHIQSQGLVGQDSTENHILSEFRRCFENWGCFRLINHGIPDTILGKVETLLREVFKLPKETKEKNVNGLPLGGYRTGAPKNFYESVEVVPEFEAIQEFSDLMWPHGNQNFCQVMPEYFERMEELSERIQKIILASLGVSNYYTPYFEDCFHRFRMNAYEVPSDEAAGSVTLRAHKDAGVMTILYEDEVGGLQVLSKAGNWVEVKPVPNSLIIFAGDTFQAWSNKRIPSITHRVIVKGKQSRISLAVFKEFAHEMVIEAPPLELVDNEHPRRYRPFKSSEYAKYKLERTLIKVKNHLNHLETFVGNEDPEYESS